MSKTARKPATGYRPSGRQCAECKRAAEDCSRLDFGVMPPAGKRDADGVQRVACSRYVRVERVSVADELKRPAVLPDSLLKLIGDYGMAREDFGVGAPGHIEAWLHLINGIKLYAGYCVQEAARSNPDQETRPCRRGPDGCADSGCPGRGEG